MALENGQNRSNSFIGKVVALLFALLVIVQPFKSFLPISYSMAIILLCSPYFLWGTIKYKGKLRYILFVALYVVFRIINHGTTFEEFATLAILLLFAITLLGNSFDFDCFLTWTVRIGSVASVCVIVQVIVHTLTGVHIPFLTTGMIRDSLLGTGYRTLITTGMSSGSYRPSAFFLEPSAFAAYCFPAIFYLIFKLKSTRGLKLALFISVGVVCTTSTMGLLLVVLIWGLLLYQASFKENKIKTKWFFIFCGAIVAGIVAFFVSSRLQFMVLRLFQGMGDSQHSAIQGRLGGGQYYISQLSREEFLFGTGLSTENLTMFLSGIYHLIYTDGILCAIIFEMMFISRIVQTKGFDRILQMLVILLSFFSDIVLIHSLMYFMVYAFTARDEVHICSPRFKLAFRR